MANSGGTDSDGEINAAMWGTYLRPPVVLSKGNPEPETKALRASEATIEGPALYAPSSFGAGYVRPVTGPLPHARDNRRVQFGILGPVQVTRDDAVVDLGGSRRVTLLAALLVRANLTCPVNYLAEVLWGDNPPAAAAATLHSHIAHLRRALEPDRSPRAAATVLRSTQNGYQLVVDPANLDAAIFESRLKAGRAALAQGQPDEALAALTEGLLLWRGEALAGFADRDFASAEATRLEQLRLDAAEARLEAQLELGANAEVIADAEHVLAEHELRERLWELLITALYRSGRQADALASYQRARSLLVEQLGVEPRPSLRKLERRILAQDPTLDRTIPASRTADQLGAHRLRPRLPIPLTSFIGRLEERAELAAALKQHRLVTAVGPGGVGKTRLALVVAEEVIHEFEDGVFFVDLSSVSEPSRVPAVIASVLSIGETQHLSIDDAILAELVDRQALIVLDNCEHLIEGVTPFTERLLQSCPRVVVLATSRARLLVPFEWVFPVAGLSMPEDGAEGDAVALFAERAAAAGDLPLSEASRRHVARICEALDGHPLSIELAAARLPALGLEGLEAALSDHLRLLAGGPRVHGRHRSLRAVIEWSEALLDTADQALLRRTAVFVTPFTAEEAVAVAGFPPVAAKAIADGLAHLTEQSLLTPIQSSDGPRYRMLETLRQYGKERLEETGELHQTRTRHLRWCSSIVAKARVSFADDLTEWRTAFDEVADDIRDALGWASEQSNRRQLAEELAMTFAGLVFARGLLSEAQQRYEHAAKLTHDAGMAATALENAAGAAFCRIVGAETVRLLEAAADVARNAGKTERAAQDLATAAMVIARHRGVFATPVPADVVDSLIARAHDLAADTPSVQAIALMVDVFRSDQNRPEQIPKANRAVALAQQAREPLIESAALDALTISMLVSGDLGGALEMALRRVTLLEPLPFHAAAGAELLDALHMVSEVSLVRGDLVSARRWAHRFSALPFLREQEHVATNRLMVIDALAGTWDELLVEGERYREGWERAGRPRGLILARGAAAVSLVHGLRGDSEAQQEWRAVAAAHGYTDDVAAAAETGWAATFDAILELHFGRANEVMEHLVIDPEQLQTSRGAAWRQWYAALWAEAAVLAGREDAITRLKRAWKLCAGNPVASAIVERGFGLATADRPRVLAAARALDEAGCRYQWARSLVLAGGAARREGEAALRAMGAAPTVTPDLHQSASEGTSAASGGGA